MLQRMARINMDWSELKLEKVGPIFTSFNVLKSSESNEGLFQHPSAIVIASEARYFRGVHVTFWWLKRVPHMGTWKIK